MDISRSSVSGIPPYDIILTLEMALLRFFVEVKLFRN